LRGTATSKEGLIPDDHYSITSSASYGRATGSGLQLDQSSVPKSVCSSLKSHPVEADNQEIT
jgi:hypothetical protein